MSSDGLHALLMTPAGANRSPMASPPSPFCTALRRVNDPALAGFDRFLLPPGTRFGDRRTWWGHGGARRHPHEGVDLSWYMDRGGNTGRLPPGTRIPALAAGRVARIVEDFLGHSLFLVHPPGEDGRLLLSVYGHVEPLLATGGEAAAGTPLAVIARPRPGRVPPHLHVSVVRLPAAFPCERLDWEFLHAAPEACFCDPLPFLACPCDSIPTVPEADPF